MTVAPLSGVMQIMSGLRWRLTVFGLDLVLRILLLGALFRRPRRD